MKIDKTKTKAANKRPDKRFDDKFVTKAGDLKKVNPKSIKNKF